MNKPRCPTRLLVPLVLLTMVGTCDRVPTAAPHDLPGNVRLVRAGADAIPGRYVVVFKDGQVGSAASLAGELVTAHGGRLHYSYDHAIEGFAAELSPEAVRALLADPRVAYVAEDQMMTMAADTQTSATWGLDRIDQRALPLDSVYTYSRTGKGVTAYVIDSGILTTHTEFGGRASVGVDFVPDGKNGQDCNGHGTHVAGTIGGATYGVAKEVNLVAVRVFGCSGGAPVSAVIAAVNWVMASAQQPAVVNMSLGGGMSQALNQALQNSIAVGNTHVVAAGNNVWEACSYSPSSTPAALTVASTTSSGTMSWFSNWGSCVDLFAPGSDITSAWWSSTTATNTLSGTSMAAPHVAGVAALYLEGYPAATPAVVATAIVNSASPNQVIHPGENSPNLLLLSPLPLAQLWVNPGAVDFGVLRPSVTGSSAGSSVAAQAFTASGAGVGKEAHDGGVVTASSRSKPLVLTNHGPAISWSVADSVTWMSVSPASGTLAKGARVTLNVMVNVASLAAGTHLTTLVMSADGQTRPIPVTVVVAQGDPLYSDVPVTGLSGVYEWERYYVISVPPGAASLVVSISGSGEADLHVRRGALPSYLQWDCKPNYGGSEERCVINEPAADDYFIWLYTNTEYSGITLLATVSGAETRPAPPAGVVARGDEPLRVNVAWSDNSDNETLFTVRRSKRNGDGTFGAYQTVGQRGPNNTSLVDSAVVLGATYRYQVQACGDAGCSSSAPSPALTIVLPPAAPTGLRAGVMPGGRVDLAWTDASGNEAFFRVRRGTRNPDGTFGAYQAIQTLAAGTTAYSNTVAVLGATYRYQVQACNAGCGTSTAVTVTVPVQPAAPTQVSAQAISPLMVKVAWTDASSNESSFNVRRSLRRPDGTFAPYQTLAAVGRGVTSFSDLTVAAGGTYRYLIQACNASACVSSASAGVTVPAS